MKESNDFYSHLRRLNLISPAWRHKVWVARAVCEHPRVWKGLEGSESKTLQASVVLEVAEAGGGVSGVRGELGADAVASVSLSGMRL